MNNQNDNRGTVDALEREISRLYSHMDRVLQAIGLVGGAVAIIVPLIAIMIGFRNDAALETQLESFEERISARIDAMEKQLGIDYAEPDIVVLTRDGQPLSAASTPAIVQPQQIAQKDDDQQSAVCPAGIEGLEEYQVEFAFLLRNQGQGMGEVDVYRIYHNGIFRDHETIAVDRFTKYPYITEWTGETIRELTVFPGGYMTPAYLYMESSTVDGAWCDPSDFEGLLGDQVIAIEVFYRSQDGISKTYFEEFTVNLADYGLK